MSFPPVETKPTIVVWIVGIRWTDERFSLEKAYKIWPVTSSSL